MSLQLIPITSYYSQEHTTFKFAFLFKSELHGQIKYYFEFGSEIKATQFSMYFIYFFQHFYTVLMVRYLRRWLVFFSFISLQQENGFVEFASAEKNE